MKTDNAKRSAKAAGNFAKHPNCTGQNVSPTFAWRNAPDKTRSYAIIWDDQAGRAGLGVSHAVIYGSINPITHWLHMGDHSPPRMKWFQVLSKSTEICIITA